MCLQYIGGYHEYIRGISWVHWGCSVHWGDIMMHVGDTMSTLGVIMSISGDVQYIGGIMMHVGLQVDKILSISIENLDALMISPNVLNILRCNHDIRRCTHDIPLMYSSYPSDVLNIPRCNHDVPLMYLWYPPDVLNTHYTGWLLWYWKKLSQVAISVNRFEISFSSSRLHNHTYVHSTGCFDKCLIKGSIEPTHGSACSDVRKLQSMDVLKLSNSLSFRTWSTYPGDKENLSNFDSPEFTHRNFNLF